MTLNQDVRHHFNVAATIMIELKMVSQVKKYYRFLISSIFDHTIPLFGSSDVKRAFARPQNCLFGPLCYQYVRSAIACSKLASILTILRHGNALQKTVFVIRPGY